jgi:hypothetical protein
MPQIKKTASANTPARRRLRSRLPDTGEARPLSDPIRMRELIVLTAPADAGDVDLPVEDPTTSRPKPSATRPRARATDKRTNKAPQITTETRPDINATDARQETNETRRKASGTRPRKRKGAAASGPKTELPQETTPAAPQNHLGGGEASVARVPAMNPPAPVVKKKAPPTLRQGTRASSRLKGQHQTTTYEPEPEVEQTKRRRGFDDEDMDVDVAEDTTEDAPTDPSKKQAKHSDDQADIQKQAEKTPINRAARVDSASDEDEDASKAVATPDRYLTRCYLQEDRNGITYMCINTFRAKEWEERLKMEAARSKSAKS